MVRGCQSRLTQQAAMYYDEVQKELQKPPLSQHFDKSWTAHVSVKSALYYVEAQLQSGIALHAQDEIAPEIARLKVRHLNVQHPALLVASLAGLDADWAPFAFIVCPPQVGHEPRFSYARLLGKHRVHVSSCPAC
jgi:hypothetical protein